MSSVVSRSGSLEGPWDVVVVGAGPAGAATALTLARSGHRVLLLEKRTGARFPVGESIPPMAMGVLRHLLGGDPIETLGPGRVFETRGNVSYWASAAPDVMDFMFTPNGNGVVVDRSFFEAHLLEMAVTAGARLLCPGMLTDCMSMEDGVWRLRVIRDVRKQAFVCRARVLVDATGRSAVLARKLGARRQSTDDALFAFAQHYEAAPKSDVDQDRDAFTRIAAAPNGWWYSNRLPGVVGQSTETRPKTRPKTRRIVVFHTDLGLSEAKQAANVLGFRRLFQRTCPMRDLLSRYGYTALGRVHGAAAGSQCLDRFGGSNWLAVGDAAQAYDPLSSLGLTKAMESALHVGCVIQRGLEGDQRQLTTSIEAYCADQAFRWRQYRQQHDHFYDNQPRWQDRPFWNRRGLRMESAPVSDNLKRVG